MYLVFTKKIKIILNIYCSLKVHIDRNTGEKIISYFFDLFPLTFIGHVLRFFLFITFSNVNDQRLPVVSKPFKSHNN